MNVIHMKWDKPMCVKERVDGVIQQYSSSDSLWKRRLYEVLLQLFVDQLKLTERLLADQIAVFNGHPQLVRLKLHVVKSLPGDTMKYTLFKLPQEHFDIDRSNYLSKNRTFITYHYHSISLVVTLVKGILGVTA